MRCIPAFIIILALILLPCPLQARQAVDWCTFDSAGVKIAYFVTGTGDPVVLIHGMNSNATINWLTPGTVKALSDKHQVIALDLRGHGKSGKPAEESAYGIQLVEDVVRLLDHLHIRKAHIVGYSMGGIITMKFLVEHPDRALSGTLGGMGWLRQGSSLQKLWERIPGREGRTPPACIHSISSLAVTEKELRSVKVPVEVIVGEQDPAKRLYVTPLSRIRKDWPVVEISGAGHLNCIVKPQFREELEKWLDKNARR